MHNLRIFALLFFLLTAFLLFISCESGPAGKTTTQSLDFVESSSGLPKEGQWRNTISFYDINLDGHLDILAPAPRKASEEEEMPFVWLGNGKGEWSSILPSVPMDLHYNYGGVVGGDFNNDRIPDMAFAFHGLGLLGLKGMGGERYESFMEGLPSRSVFITRALSAADFNNDGIADIAAVSEAPFDKKMRDGNAIMVCLGSPSGWDCRAVGEKTQTQGLFADKIVTGDVNGDGNVDLGIASLQHARDLIIWLGNGKGEFSPFNQGLMTEQHYASVALSDLNGDGRDDLIASIPGFSRDSAKFLKVYLSEKDGFKDASQGLPDNEVYLAVSAGDLDGDGVPEIVAGTAMGAIHVFAQKKGKWGQLKTSGLPEGGLWRLYNVYCVDINRDGLDDIALNYATEKNNTGAIRVFLSVPHPKK